MHNMQPHNPRHMLRARGNLSYLEFLHLVKRTWEEVHPDIPMIPAGGGKPAKYPCIYYGLDLRKTHPSDPKVRHRESMEGDDGEALIISGQRFQNIVKYTVASETTSAGGVDQADRIIEEFEDFMMEYTPAFKELGASELVYSRRYSDHEDNRQGLAVVTRAVAYLVTTEKVTKTEYGKLKQIVIDARTWLQEMAEATHDLGGSMSGITPRYYAPWGEAPEYEVRQVEEDGETIFRLYVPNTSFLPGDIVFISPDHQGVPSIGRYMIGAGSDPWSDNSNYDLYRVQEDPNEDPELVNLEDTGSGKIYFIATKGVTARIVDQFFGDSSSNSTES